MSYVQFRHVAISLLCVLTTLSCSCTVQSPTVALKPSYSDLPITVDPRPRFVLLSWTVKNHSAQFALIRDPDGTRLNEFLNAYDHGQTAGISLASLEQMLAHLPRTSVVEWWYDNARRISLPSVTVVRRIEHLAAQHHAHLRFQDANNTASD